MNHYRFIDFATQFYIVAIGLLIAVFHGNRIDHWVLLAACHALGLGLVHLLILVQAARPHVRWLDFLRHFYPVLLYTAFYRETGQLNHMFITGYLDPWFIGLEERLLGFQPSVRLMQWLPYLWVSELFYVSYFSYYVMILGVGLALYARDRRAFQHYLSVVSFAFYVCYCIYVVLPVIGPRLFFQEFDGYALPARLIPEGSSPALPGTVASGLFFQIMAWIYEHFEAPGAAFPSSHVVVALCTLHFSNLYLPRVRPVHFVFVVLLCFSTVYCHYHYVVDVIAGLMMAGVVIPLGHRLYQRFARKNLAPLAPARGKSSVPSGPAHRS